MTHKLSKIVTAQQLVSRPFIANAVRGLLLLIDVFVGAVLVFVSFHFLMIPIEDGGPFSLPLPTALLCVLSATIGIWLIVSGVLLVLLKRPKCWRTGRWTHVATALGIFLFIPALYFQSQYQLQVRPGHMAMEAAGAVAIISIGVAIIAAVWLLAAGVLNVFDRIDR